MADQIATLYAPLAALGVITYVGKKVYDSITPVAVQSREKAPKVASKPKAAQPEAVSVSQAKGTQPNKADAAKAQKRVRPPSSLHPVARPSSAAR
jgi:hypothetical protein